MPGQTPAASFETLVATEPATPAPRPSLRATALAEARVLGGLLAAGVLVGVLWAVLVPLAQSHSDPGEQAVAGDGTLGLVGAVAGVGTALLLARRPGALPSLRAATVLTAAVLGSGVAALAGRLAGAPGPHAVGMLLVWPLAAAAVTLVRLLITLLISPD